MENHWWIVFILISSAITAITVFFDNYIVDVTFKNRSPISQKIVYTILHLVVIAVILVFFPIQELPINTILLIILSGAAYSLALVPYYIALKKEDSTMVEIFSQAEPLMCLLMGWIIFGENLTGWQSVAFFLILAGAIIAILSKGKRGQKTGLMASFLVVVAASLWAVADLTFASAGENLDYATTLLYVLVGRLMVDMVITIMAKKERRYCYKILRKSGLKAWAMIIIDYVLEISGDLVYRFGLLMAPVALASVTAASSELIFTFLFGIILTLIVPKFGREKLTTKIILSHLAAIVLLIVGIVLIG